MKVALALTIFRILLSPIFLALYLYAHQLGMSMQFLPIALLGVLGFAELTDAFDGYFARKHNGVTDLGKILDPMADSIFRISVFLAFTQGPVKLPLLLVTVFVYRDSIIGMLRTLCALRGFALAARMSGKIKAVIQAAVAFLITILLFFYSWGWISQKCLENVSFYSLLAAAIYTVYTGVEYIYVNRSYIRKAIR